MIGMYIIFLISLMLLSSYELVIKRRVSHKKTYQNEDRYINGLKVIVVILLSICIAKYGVTLGEISIFFLISFISLICLIELIVDCMMWLQDYMNQLTMRAFCSVAIPVIVLWHVQYITTRVERLLVLAAILMSLSIVYIELVKMINNRSDKQGLKVNRRFKLQSIITWFIIIILNQYTLLLIIQFYFDKEAHHFITAETLSLSTMVDLFYYLIITFTTVGFGDIQPGTEIAKMITCLIAMTGMLFTGLFIGGVLSEQTSD